MKTHVLSVVSIFTLIAAFALLIYANIGNIRWDKIPIIRIFCLEIELGSSSFDASHLTEPITWNQLDEAPNGWDVDQNGFWFWFNTYTKNMLKDYMRENNLGIIPDNWSDFKFTADFEDCLETFEFVRLGEPQKTVNYGTRICNFIGITLMLLSFSIGIYLIIVLCRKR